MTPPLHTLDVKQYWPPPSMASTLRRVSKLVGVDRQAGLAHRPFLIRRPDECVSVSSFHADEDAKPSVEIGMA
jgi:hypothetical protein